MDANQYINQNYPRINRTDITMLDISNKNLTNTITLDYFNITLKLNASFNQISTFIIEQLPLQIMDFSHNLLTNFSISQDNSTLQIINLSHNYLSDIGPISNILTHLDVSNNNLTNLDLSDYVHLTSLDCSANPNLSKLTLPLHSYFNPKDLSNFDSRGTNLGIINTTSFSIECQNGIRSVTTPLDTNNPPN
ncbi:4612_t:CDS:1, partial [Gigaspora rosea]